MTRQQWPAGAARRRVSMTLSAQARAYLDELVEHGLFGVTPSDVARRLVEDGLRRAAAEGWIAIPPVARGGRRS